MAFVLSRSAHRKRLGPALSRRIRDFFRAGDYASCGSEQARTAKKSKGGAAKVGKAGAGGAGAAAGAGLGDVDADGDEEMW